MSAVYVKNVFFGDCNIIEHEDAILIVDCGSDNKGSDPDSNSILPLPACEFAYSKIKFLVNEPAKVKNLLISHYHSDHFNSILELERQGKIKFTNIYLPLTIISENDLKAHESSVHWLALLFCVAVRNSYADKLTKRLLIFLKRLADIVYDFNNVVCLKRGDSFRLGTLSNEVLWPDVTLLKKIYSDDEGAEGTTAGVLSLQRKEDYKNCFIVLNSVADEANPEKPDSSDFEKVLEMLCSIFKILNKNEHGDDRERYARLLEELEIFTDNVQRKMTVFYGSLPADEKKFVREILFAAYHHYIECENSCSIVFQDKSIGNTGKYIFLGDVTDKVIEAIHYSKDGPSFKACYDVVKVQHHGTGKHFSQYMPVGRNYIVSNGGYSSRKVSKDLIEQIFKQHPGARLYCTGAHKDRTYCEYEGNDCPFYCCNKALFGDNTIQI